MAILLTISADGPGPIAGIWDQLREHTATVDIVGEEMFIEVDLCAPSAEVDPEDTEPADEDPLLDETTDPHEPERDAAAEVEPLAVEPEPDPVPEKAAEVVPIDQKSRERHPASNGDLTCGEAIIAMLTDEPDVTFSIMDIALALPTFKESTVKFTTAQLSRDGKIARAERGLYQAVPAS